jgi:hypothetical protein
VKDGSTGPLFKTAKGLKSIKLDLNEPRREQGLGKRTSLMEAVVIDLHALIVEHVRTVNKGFESRLLDLYYHLRMLSPTMRSRRSPCLSTRRSPASARRRISYIQVSKILGSSVASRGNRINPDLASIARNTSRSRSP